MALVISAIRLKRALLAFGMVTFPYSAIRAEHASCASRVARARNHGWVGAMIRGLIVPIFEGRCGTIGGSQDAIAGVGLFAKQRCWYVAENGANAYAWNFLADMCRELVKLVG